MSEIKLTIDGTDYKLSRMAGISDPSPTPFMVFEGKSYMGEAIPKEKDIPKEFDYDVLCWECKDGKDAYKRPSTVKRLTDNSVFNVGDETDKGKITMFTIQKDNLYVHIDHLWYYINHIQKVKPKVPLFTCVTGEEIFEDYEDVIWRVFIRNSSYENWKPYDLGIPVYPNEDERYFIKKEDAYEYILNNRPILSLNEIKEQFNKRDFVGTDYIMQKLRMEVKEKLDI